MQEEGRVPQAAQGAASLSQGPAALQSSIHYCRMLTEKF